MPVPLLVCGAKNDIVIDRNQLDGWQKYLKDGDRLWLSDDGYHFFHYFAPEKVEAQIWNFWKSLPDRATLKILV